MLTGLRIYLQKRSIGFALPGFGFRPAAGNTGLCSARLLVAAVVLPFVFAAVPAPAQPPAPQPPRPGRKEIPTAAEPGAGERNGSKKAVPGNSLQRLKLSPETVQALNYHRKGDTLLREGDMTAAALAYALAAERIPSDPMLRLSAGVALSEVGMVKDAAVQFRQALRFAEDDVIASLLLQNALTELGAGTEAQEIYQDTYRRFSRTEEKGLNVSSSITRLNTALKTYGDSPVFYLLLGDAHQLSEQWSSAERAYLRANALAPRWSKPLVNLGVSRMARGRIEDAVQTFEKALALDPRNKQAQVLKMTGQGQAYANARSFPEALETLNSAQKLAPNDPTPSVMIAQINTEKGDYAAAAGAYESALKIIRSGGLFAQRPVIFRLLAEAWLFAHQPEKARAVLQQALSDESANAPLWYSLLAQSHFEQDDPENGQAMLKAALDSEPGPYPLVTLRAIDSRQLLTPLQETYKRELEAARTGISAAASGRGVTLRMASPAERSPDNRVRAMVALAHIARYRGEFREEVRLRQELTRLRENPWDWYLMAETYDLRIREPAPARDAYRSALEMANRTGGLNDATRQFARERLQALTSPAYKPE